jgi:hypothetical protein
MTDSPRGEQSAQTRLIRSYDVFLHFFAMLDGKPMPRGPPSKSLSGVDTPSFLSYIQPTQDFWSEGAR